MMQAVAAQLDQLLIQRFGGYQSLALYSVAAVIPEQTKHFINSLSGTFLQRLSRQQKTQGHLKAIRRHFWIAFSASAALVIAYAFFAPMILPWLFPQYGSGSIGLSMVYMIGLLATPSVIGLYFLQAHGELALLWRYYVTNTVLQLATTLALIPFFGSWGAVWAKTMTRLASFPLSYPQLRSPHPETDSKTAR
jgi:O-antigen/teichoic acid export membrane protein